MARRWNAESLSKRRMCTSQAPTLVRFLSPSANHRSPLDDADSTSPSSAAPAPAEPRRRRRSPRPPRPEPPRGARRSGRGTPRARAAVPWLDPPPPARLRRRRRRRRRDRPGPGSRNSSRARVRIAARAADLVNLDRALHHALHGVRELQLRPLAQRGDGHGVPPRRDTRLQLDVAHVGSALHRPQPPRPGDVELVRERLGRTALLVAASPISGALEPATTLYLISPLAGSS